MRSFLMKSGHVVVVTDLGTQLVQLKREHDSLPENHGRRRLLMKKMRGIADQMVKH